MDKSILIFQADNFSLSPFSRNLSNLAPELQKKGWRIRLVTVRKSGMESLPEHVEGKTLTEWLPSWSRIPRHYAAVVEMAMCIRFYRPSIIIARGTPFGVSVILSRALSGLHPRIVTTLHSSVSGYINGRSYRSWPLFARLSRFAVNRSDSAVAVSRGVSEDYIAVTGICQAKIRVIYNPVVVPEISALANRPVEEEWLRSDRTHKTILHVGRFAPEKDHRSLLRALVELRKRRDVRLLLIGDGLLREQIQNEIIELNLTNVVKLLGRKENPFSYMSKADALVLSSKFEGLPGVLIQAMAVGCPVVSTNCESGADEILDYGRWGPLVPVGDYVKLASAVGEVLSNPMPKDALIDRASFFSATSSASQWMSLFEELLMRK